MTVDFVHPVYGLLKLGGRLSPPERKTVDLLKVLKALPPLPAADIDNWGNLADFMDGNDTAGDCTIAAIAKQVRLNEKAETGVMPIISTQDVLNFYYKLTGGPDSGLDMHTVMQAMITSGFPYGAAIEKYYAYGEVPVNDSNVRYVVWLMRSALLTIALPISAQSQVGQVWEMVPDDGSGNTQPGSWGYHEVLDPTYKANAGNHIIRTWGLAQAMTPAFLEKYVIECRGIIPLASSSDIDSAIDYAKLNGELKQLDPGYVPPPLPPPVPPTPPKPPRESCWERIIDLFTRSKQARRKL